MKLNHLSDDQLHDSTEKAASAQRRCTLELLHHLNEVGRRKLYGRRGCSSLHEYCIKFLRMSGGEANRRINAARMMAEVPTVADKLRTGELSLTAASQAQALFNQEAKLEKPIALEEKKQIVDQLSNLSTRDVEKKLIERSSIPKPIKPERKKRVTKTHTEIRFYVEDDVLENLKRLKGFWSHEMPGATYAQLVKKMAELLCTQLDPLEKAKRAEQRKAKTSSQRAKNTAEAHNEERTAPAPAAAQASSASINVSSQRDECKPAEANPTVLRSASQAQAQEQAEVASDQQSSAPAPGFAERPANSEFKVPPLSQGRERRNNSRYVSAAVKHTVWMHDQGRCTFVDESTGKVCGSSQLLQIDHRVPFARGGQNSADNLRLLCALHNRLHATDCFGFEHIERASRKSGRDEINNNC